MIAMHSLLCRQFISGKAIGYATETALITFIRPAVNIAPTSNNTCQDYKSQCTAPCKFYTLLLRP